METGNRLAGGGHMVTLEGNRLVFRFPEVHAEAICSITFKRTLRLPDDGKEYPLPPGFENFPLTHVEDFHDRVPPDWRTRGGIFLPMHQAEAMWINFEGFYPFAVKIAAGKIDALTGETWSNNLNPHSQDYVVIPGQPWLDGFAIGQGKVRQFVAMPLGEGFTAEEQITGTGEFGGIQIAVYPMRRDRFEEEERQRRLREANYRNGIDDMATYCRANTMGLSPGGVMRQEIYKDRFGLSAWETGAYSRCFVHIANSAEYLAITGHKPPMKSPTAKDYSAAGLPWFELYAKDKEVLQGSSVLANLLGIAARGRRLKRKIIPGNEPVESRRVINLGEGDRDRIKDGNW